jgi:hypothetical protein
LCKAAVQPGLDGAHRVPEAARNLVAAEPGVVSKEHDFAPLGVQGLQTRLQALQVLALLGGGERIGALVGNVECLGRVLDRKGLAIVAIQAIGDALAGS